MDRLIWAAWRAFWVGLGASAVLIAQSLFAPAPAAFTAPPPNADVIESLVPPPPPPRRAERVDHGDRANGATPTLTRSAFESTRGKVVARVRNES